MRIFNRVLLVLFIPMLTMVVNAQSVKYDWQTTVGGVPSVVVVPATTTAVVSVTAPRYVRVDEVVLHNITGTAATVTITDRTTNCNSGACSVVSFPLTVAAQSTYIMNLSGQPAGGGVSWSSSTANAVQGWIAGRYDVQR